MGHPVKWKRKAYIGLSFLLLVGFMLILNVTTLNYTYGTKNQVSVNVTDTVQMEMIQYLTPYSMDQQQTLVSL